ncbi:MAG: hypothetical protein NWQ54_20370 [Paraglaciecola sp.]|uniref:hypothetical protein n=1 Tax=Pseudomonadati TaxID=3379134 RepID=UPI00273E2477|nr:hypothetical protein [Paraglaciecola sp.]MDP5029627.1 hypothetical protein [Paraglaciecola sp.]MDP5133243.1 hypothetical protein [Paraglaciecola sp.]
MKLILVIYIGLLTLLGYVVQLGLPTQNLTLAFIALNIVFLPIIIAYLLKFYFTFSLRHKNY